MPTLAGGGAGGGGGGSRGAARGTRGWVACCRAQLRSHTHLAPTLPPPPPRQPLTSPSQMEEDFMKAARKIAEGKKLESKMEYSKV